MTLKARVKAGRLVVDEAPDLPEGTVVELLPLDPGDWLDEDDRAALHQAFKDSDEDVTAGRLFDPVRCRRTHQTDPERTNGLGRGASERSRSPIPNSHISDHVSQP